MSLRGCGFNFRYLLVTCHLLVKSVVWHNREWWLEQCYRITDDYFMCFMGYYNYKLIETFNTVFIVDHRKNMNVPLFAQISFFSYKVKFVPLQNVILLLWLGQETWAASVNVHVGQYRWNTQREEGNYGKKKPRWKPVCHQCHQSHLCLCP